MSDAFAYWGDKKKYELIEALQGVEAFYDAHALTNLAPTQDRWDRLGRLLGKDIEQSVSTADSVYGPVESSNIQQVGWKAATSGPGTLFIWFKSGRIYSYQDVSVQTARELLVAESPGRAFGSLVRNAGYVYREIDSWPADLA